MPDDPTSDTEIQPKSRNAAETDCTEASLPRRVSLRRTSKTSSSTQPFGPIIAERGNYPGARRGGRRPQPALVKGWLRRWLVAPGFTSSKCLLGRFTRTRVVPGWPLLQPSRVHGHACTTYSNNSVGQKFRRSPK